MYSAGPSADTFREALSDYKLLSTNVRKTIFRRQAVILKKRGFAHTLSHALRESGPLHGLPSMLRGRGVAHALSCLEGVRAIAWLAQLRL